MPKGQYIRKPRPARNFRPAIHVIGPSIAYVPLTHGKFAVIDSDNIDLINQRTWRAHNDPKSGDRWYAFAGAESIRMHRLVLGVDSSMMVDHVQPDRTLDNRRANLRPATHAQNQHNKGRNKNNTSGVKGVSIHPHGGYTAAITIGGKDIYLGYSKDLEVARQMRVAAAKAYHGEFYREE